LAEIGDRHGFHQQVLDHKDDTVPYDREVVVGDGVVVIGLDGH
jgi:hypothetical protein